MALFDNQSFEFFGKNEFWNSKFLETVIKKQKNLSLCE